MNRFLLYHSDLKRPVKISDPSGWDAERKTIEREPELHGVFVRYNPELRFVRDGRALIALLYNQYGIEADITIIIERKNMTTRVWEVQYSGRLDLTSLVIEKVTATCKIDDIGFYQKLKNRNTILVNLQSLIDQDGNAMPQLGSDLSLSLHSKALSKTFKGFMAQSPTLQLTFASGKFIQYGYDPNNVDEITNRLWYQFQAADIVYEWFQIEEGGSYTFNLNILMMHVKTGASAASAPFYLQINGNSPVNFTLVNTYVASPALNIHAHWRLTYTVTLGAGDKVYLYGQNNYGSSAVFDIENNFWANSILTSFGQPLAPADADTVCEVTALTTFPSTEAITVPIHEAWQRVVQSATGKSNSFKSDYYGRVENGYASDGPGSLRVITNGNQVRQLPIIDKPIFTSPKELVDACRAIDGVGLGLEKNTNGSDRLRVEPLSFFYQNVKALRLDYVQDISREVAEPFYYNEMDLGYANWNARGKQLNNLDEFNTKRNYALPISQVKRKLALLCPWIASGYVIEFVRREGATSQTTDTEQDNLNFIICLRRSGPSLVTEKNEAVTVANVIDASSVYNARITPMNNLLRNGQMIRSGLYKRDTLTIKMTLGEGNNEITTITSPSPDVVNEKEIAITKLGKPLWLPEFYNFSAAPSTADWAAFEQNPYGYIEFSANNKNHVKGYLTLATPDSDDRRVKFKLLAAAL